MAATAAAAYFVVHGHDAAASGVGPEPWIGYSII
jgi:hypothetical protein